MMIPQISRVFVPESATAVNFDGLEPASIDEDLRVIGPAGEYPFQGFLVPVNEMELHGIPELVAQPAAMIIGLSTHEQAVLARHAGGMWELQLRTGRGLPETYSFRDHPEPRPVAKVVRRPQAVW